jgi:hypothetical protein
VNSDILEGKMNIIKPIILLVALMASGNAVAMRCGGSLILEGDSEAKLLEKCGEPLMKTDQSIMSSDSKYIYKNSGGGYNELRITHGKVQSEEWN